MQTSAISKLGKGMAGKIGEAAENKDINQVVRYMSHAALGCGIGLATANVHGSDKKNKISCLSGAGGAVAGEVIGDIYKSQSDYDNTQLKAAEKLANLRLDPENKTLEQDYQQLIDQLQDIKKTGVDLARLSVAVGAMVANIDVNIAADAAENAVDNNVFGQILRGVFFYADFIALCELADRVDDIKAFVEDLKEAPEEQQIQMIKGVAEDFAAEVIMTMGSKAATKLLSAGLNKFEFGKKLNAAFEDVINQIEQGTFKHPKLGIGQKPSVSIADQPQRLLSGKPGVVTGGSSTKLGKNLNESMGKNRSDSWTGYQAQHLIPSELKSHPILKKVGMDLDDASNGIFLPASKAKPEGSISGLPRHTGSHPNYTLAVRKSLNEMDNSLPIAQLQKQVYDLQVKLRSITESGMPVRNKDGAKTEVWLQWINK
ncbi:AHH domain-containing protein [uncultured Shewanella sp.]|uniref:AHH domain-containing protein n=1 Tax=uncultured Shewanella sp. TaxID=173975 RepID=UPI00261E1126|nr:AHH domain-containing protein [uncultured Shewanella sp.]